MKKTKSKKRVIKSYKKIKRSKSRKKTRKELEREDTSESDVKISPSVYQSIEDYKVGQEVIYISKTDKGEQKATIVKIYKNVGPGEEPFIDIKLNSGKIRQTILDRIRPIY